MNDRAILNAPTGTTTFLFTDMEGSTKLWEAYPEQMRAALARHDGLLRKAITDAKGFVFKTVGDAFCAAFGAATDAVAAAIAAQLALAAEPWLQETPIRVRMALHSGEAEFRDGDYFGPPLNRTARLLTAAHGGQVLLSLAVQELARSGLPAAADLRDMGERRLKDLVRPERIYQLVAPGLQADFPPLRTLDTRTNNLPIQTTSFVGRAAEMQELTRLLHGSRLVTLTGTGGCGKTRLAMQCAADLTGAFPQGVWLVELAPLTDARLVPGAVAAVMNVREEPGHSLTDSLVSHLNEQTTLIVLDNCEHVVHACAELSQRLISSCSGLRMLATSREALRVPGESVFRVPSLSTPDPATDTTVDRLSLRDGAPVRGAGIAGRHPLRHQ